MKLKHGVLIMVMGAMLFIGLRIFLLKSKNSNLNNLLYENLGTKLENRENQQIVKGEPWRREPQGGLRILFEHDDLTYDELTSYLLIGGSKPPPYKSGRAGVMMLGAKRTVLAPAAVIAKMPSYETSWSTTSEADLQSDHIRIVVTYHPVWTTGIRPMDCSLCPFK